MWLFYVRHGDPDYANDCLTENGRRQAAALAERFSELGLDKIYSSTMGRAKETAGFTAEKLNLDVEGLDFAREDLAGRDFGIVTAGGKKTWCFWEEKTVEVFKSAEVKKLGEKWYDHPFFDGTTYKDGILRVKKGTVDFMQKLGYSYNEQTGYYSAEKHVYDRVALFAHGGFSMSFISCILNIPFPEFCIRFQHIGASAVTVFKIDDNGKEIMPQIYQYGNDGHVYKNGLIKEFDIRPF